MANSDSEEEALYDLEFERTPEADEDVEDEILGALEGEMAAAAEEGTEGEDDTDTDDTDNASDDEDAEDQALPNLAAELEAAVAALPVSHSTSPPPQDSPPPKAPSPVSQWRSLSPAQIRRNGLFADFHGLRSYTVEAICAIPQPVPTHCLASSLCMTHLITGSEDGYIRDYDIFGAVNGKVFLTAPQRHHCGVMEGLMKAAQIKCWWENPADLRGLTGPVDEVPLCAPYSLLMQSDALWVLAGTERGHINLFTLRHEPGRLCHVMHEHRAPVSSMSMQYDEKGFFSAGWDGEALQWDLNTGQVVRNFKSHGSQLTAIAVRPLEADFHGDLFEGRTSPQQLYANPPTSQEFYPNSLQGFQPEDVKPKAEQLGMESLPPASSEPAPPGMPYTMPQEEDTKSDTSYDPLFDDAPDGDGEPDSETASQTASSSQPPPAAPQFGMGYPQNPQQPQHTPQPHHRSVSGATAPKNAPPILDPQTYTSYSPDVLMVASIDGQIVLWDRRVHSPGTGVGRLWMSEKTPPWCVSACWSADGRQIYAGRRNGTIEIYDVRQTGVASMGTPNILKTLRNPISSGVVSCVVAFPDGRHLACASNDNLRLWNVAEAGEPDAWGKMRSGVQFKIIPGHHGGFISQMLVDKSARFLISASSNRGWHGESTRTVFVHEVKHLY